MRRALTVVVIAVLTAMISGVNDTTWALQKQDTQTRDAHQKEIAARLAGIPIGSPIEVEPVRGPKFQALLEDVTADAITVRVAAANYAVTRTIPVDEIKTVKRISRIGSSKARTVLKVAGITAAVLVGTCAAAVLISADTSQPLPEVRDDASP